MKEAAYRDLIPGIEDHRPYMSYPVDAIIAAATMYAESGVTVRVSEQTGIPRKTLEHWQGNRVEWADTVAMCRLIKADQHISMYTDLVDASMKKANKALKTLEVKSATDVKALVMSAAIAQDKSRLLQNLPTSISSKTDDSKLKDLQMKFEELAGKTIEGEVL
jgi:hypothetical protein